MADDDDNFTYASANTVHVGYFVEADTFAQIVLSKRYNLDIDPREVGVSIGDTIGTYILFYFASPRERPDRVICFYTPIPALVDWYAVSAFIDKLRGQRAKCRASTFEQCVAWCNK